ncbi:MAG: hypothetical protein RI556_12165 [Hydrogenovibrio sp.]|uniref:DUF6933 domain-containing protein n=1 Tax=Hydrogenovibrio sp. TaxID=2065821 RepID=UPI00286FEF8B|nr:hypothetical protein [Hydrogenovibrio sp.]MDR9499923.1 hypothetical protein [Hydrogenovibrio sp.]
MIRFHCSKVLYNYLKPPSQPENTSTDAIHPVVGDWHAELVDTGRKKHILFCHDISRAIVLITDVKKSDIKILDRRFEDVLLHMLLKAGVEPRLFESFADSMINQNYTWDHHTDRSVRATMRLRVGDLMSMFEFGQLTPDSISESAVSLNLTGMPLSTKQDGKQRHFWSLHVLNYDFQKQYDPERCSHHLTEGCVPASIHSENDFLNFARLLLSQVKDFSQVVKWGEQAYQKFQKNWLVPDDTEHLKASIVHAYQAYEPTTNGAFKDHYTVKLFEALRMRLK